MFSGFRYIFGYNDETATQEVDDGSATSASAQGRGLTASQTLEASTANKLEQTLNAATTKFTEQLLPQQASIEELQSSSHHLLPSIIEQHEEEDLKKKSSICEPDEVVVDDGDDKDGFNEDSWELLDLVETAEGEVAPVSLTSSVQHGGAISQGLSKSTSGILKSQKVCDVNTSNNLQKRQKPKVSFEASELVKSKQEIEQTMSSGAIASGSDKVEAAHKLVDNVNCKKMPTLNYAKALSKKLATENTLSKSTLEASPSTSKNVNEEASDSLGPVKRVRPTRVSTSSWSSQDDEDNIEQVDRTDWEISIEENPKNGDLNQDADDNESIISSGFSDCDYGFDGIGDYVVRPKRANAKRGRTVSGSSATNTRMKSNHLERKVTAAKAKSNSETKNEVKSGEVRDLKSSDSSRNSKPKKKRMLMTAAKKSVSLSDFLKHKPGNCSKDIVRQNTHKTASEANQQTAQKQSVGGGSTESSDIAEMDESWFVTPPPCFTKAAKVDSLGKVESPKSKDNDQENALIEHPSVYIAYATSKSLNEANHDTAKLKPLGISKAKSACPRLDAFDENTMTLEDESWNSGDEENDLEPSDAQAVPVSKIEGNRKIKVTSYQKATVEGNIDSEKSLSDKMEVFVTASSSKAKATKKKSPKSNGKGRAQAKSASVMLKPSENKAWKNKFIVDAWDLDDNYDVDSDFDDMFESTSKEISTKTKKRQKQVKVKEVSAGKKSQRSTEIASFDYSSSSSVELLSVKSLATAEFENNENLGPQSTGVAVSEQQVLEEPKQSTAPQISESKIEQRRPPTQVRPLEPERVPSWQLKRQRSKRRPLATVSVVSKKQPQGSLVIPTPKASKAKNESLASASSSSRSTPTLIDRIGCSIVANLTNLTNGFVSSGAMNYCSSNGQASMVEGQERTVASKANFNNSAAQVAHKQLSRGSIRRQNICAKQGNTLRRPGRRLKLFTTQNGCSINRKVHTSIH